MQVPILTIDFLNGKNLLCFISNSCINICYHPSPFHFFFFCCLALLVSYLSNNRLILKMAKAFLLSQQYFQRTLGGQSRKHGMHISLLKNKQIDK